MKKVIVAAVLTLSIVFPAASFAGAMYNTQIYSIETISDGIVVVNLIGTHTNKPACSVSRAFAFDSKTDAGKTIFSTLMRSFDFSSVYLHVYGKGTCIAPYSFEEIHQVTLF